MEFSYETIKQLAKETGRKVTDLIALAPQNDPFYQGTPATLALAEWFAEIYHKQGWARVRNHVRRCHYQLVSLSVTMPNGLPYENTEQCWDKLAIAAKAARYLGLVDMATFDDRRNDDAISFESVQHVPSMGVVDDYLYTSALQVPDFPALPGYSLFDFEGNQRYHIELWCEKTTMNDVLEPLCQEYGAVLQTGAGELSITVARQLAQRIQANGKEARVFYISDFDPAGQSMPVAIARKLEYFVREFQLEADIRLFPIVLTEEQVRRYQLPRTPIKESEKRRDRFEQQFGTGAVELDALEALRPGELDRIVRAHIERYYDTDLRDAVRNASDNIERVLRQARREVLATHDREITSAREQLEQIQADFAPRMASYSSAIQGLWQAISDDLQNNMPDITDHPLPESQDGDEIGEGLYHSGRDYLSQIDAYKEFQGK